jgi:hypothetical protein
VFAVYDGVALFSGFDSSGNLELWKTSGCGENGNKSRLRVAIWGMTP